MQSNLRRNQIKLNHEWEPILPSLNYVLPSFKIRLLPSFQRVGTTKIILLDSGNTWQQVDISLTLITNLEIHISTFNRRQHNLLHLNSLLQLLEGWVTSWINVELALKIYWTLKDRYVSTSASTLNTGHLHLKMIPLPHQTLTMNKQKDAFWLPTLLDSADLLCTSHLC